MSDWSFKKPTPFKKSINHKLNLEEIEKLLLEIPRNEPEKMISEPPVCPEGGDVFIYKSNFLQPKERLDFRFDQYRWISKGSNQHSNRKKTSNVVIRYYYIKDPNGKDKDSLTGFKRMVYSLLNSQEGIFLLHYIGDSSLATPIPHGNAKISTRPYIPTKKKVMRDIKEQADVRNPRGVYSKLHEFSESRPKLSIPVSCPRDRKQVENTFLRYRGEGRLSNDEIFSLYEFAIHTEFVRKMTIFPRLVIHAWDADAIRLGNDLLRENILHPALPQLLSYDTTFNLGDFYVSPLVMRNTLLEGEPIFPVAFLIHDRKFKADHREFLEDAMTVLVGKGGFSKIPLVTDREKGIMSSIQNKFNGIEHVLCRIHILHDVEAWVKSKGGKIGDIKVMKDDIERLLNCNSKKEFDDLFKELRTRWTKSFLSYVDVHLKQDMTEHACNFVTSKFPAFQDGKIATNNISESFNRVLKDEVKWKDSPVDTMLLTLYYLQHFYLYEFSRAFKGLGNYVAKEMATVKQAQFEYIGLCQFQSIGDIISNLKGKAEIFKSVERTPTFRMTQKSMAQVCVEKGHIGFASQTSSFTVLNLNGKGLSTVQLFPPPATCTCPSTGLCYHIIAVKVALKMETRKDDEKEDDKKTYRLSVMKRKARGKGKKSGRKKPRLFDYDYTVEPADDSIQVERKKEQSPSTVEMKEYSVAFDPDLSISEPRLCSTPKKTMTKCQKVTEIHAYPWDESEELVRKELGSQKNIPSHLQAALKTLNPKKWLNSDAIDESIQALIVSAYQDSCCLLCPTFIYQATYGNNFEVTLDFLKRSEALNKDIFLIPINLDPIGSGTHWCLVVASLATKRIIMLDSASKKGYESCAVIFSNILWIIEAAHRVASVGFNYASWKCLFGTDTFPQPNGYDCGLYTVLNAYTVITGMSYGEINSPKVRKWLQMKILKCRNDQSCDGRKKTSGIGDLTILKIDPSLINFEDEPVQKFLQNMIEELNLSKNWTFCANSTCSGYELDIQIMCCACRKWYHKQCLHDKQFEPYYFCSSCVT